MLYCQAVFNRGTGFGNRLFPWARCRIFSRLCGIPTLACDWTRLGIGPLLRGGINLRSYHRQILLLGLFDSPPGDIRGAKKACLELTCRRLAEPTNFSILPNELPKKGIFVFRGEGDCFRPLFGYEAFLLEALRAMTRARWLKLVEETGSVPIGINVRLAKDFPRMTPKDLVSPTGPIQTPIDWFVQTLKAIRSEAGYPAKAYVVSDGSRRDLRELLALENVYLLRPGCAISDLLVLSKSRVLIASGGSAFSAWAVFLGGMPSVSIPGQPLAWFGLRGSSDTYLGELRPDRPPEAFMRQVKEALSR